MSLTLYRSRVRSSEVLGAESRCETFARAHVLEVAHLRDRYPSVLRIPGHAENTNHCDNRTIVISARTSELLCEAFRRAEVEIEVRPIVRASKEHLGARTPLVP
jgi:hypothetical protein